MVADDEAVQIMAHSHYDLFRVRGLVRVIVQTDWPLYVAFVDAHEVVFIEVDLLQDDDVGALDEFGGFWVRLVVFLEAVVQEETVNKTDSFKTSL